MARNCKDLEILRIRIDNLYNGQFHFNLETVKFNKLTSPSNLTNREVRSFSVNEEILHIIVKNNSVFISTKNNLIVEFNHLSGSIVQYIKTENQANAMVIFENNNKLVYGQNGKTIIYDLVSNSIDSTIVLKDNDKDINIFV